MTDPTHESSFMFRLLGHRSFLSWLFGSMDYEDDMEMPKTLTLTTVMRRIADTRPDSGEAGGDPFCFFCGEWFVGFLATTDALKPEKHKPDCLWRQAVEYVPVPVCVAHNEDAKGRKS